MTINNVNPLKPKKKRVYKGKEIERPESDTERRERLMPGTKELQKLARGVTEDEEENCLIDDEINDEEEDEEDCLIPLRWATLASSNPDTQKQMIKTISEARKRQKQDLLTEKKKKETKKNCEPGNPWRDDLGRMTSPDKAASWSIGNQDGVGRSDCKHGKKKKSGSGRSTAWTKLGCGREDVTDPNIKAKHRCKDGSVVKEEETKEDDWSKTVDPYVGQLHDRLQKILDREPNFIKHLTFLVKPLIDIEHQSERDTKQRDNSRYDDEQRDKPQMNGTRSERSPNDLMAVDEKKNRHKGMTREEIRTLCSRSGFFGWTDFLMKLSAIEQAKKGSINQQKQK